MKAVCFACGAEFHLLVSFILATTVYQKQKKVLLLYKHQRITAYLNRIKNLQVWDEIVVIDPESPKETGTAQIENLSEDIETLHFFSWGFPPFNLLFRLCNEKKSKIIFTDEGIGTYMPYKRFYAWLELRPEYKEIVRDFDIKEIDEIWLLEPKLYLDDPILPVNKISIDAFYRTCSENQQIVEDFNTLFPIPPDVSFDFDVIYFRQYFYLYEIFSEQTDAFIDEFILKHLQKYNYCIKNHPANTSSLYRQDNEVQVNFPWEAIVISSIINSDSHLGLPKVYISPTSSGMFKSWTLGISGEFIFLHKLIERYADFRDPTIDEFLELNRTVFPEANLYVPETWSDFERILAEVAKKLQIPAKEGSLDGVQFENNWLLGNQRHFWGIIKKQASEISDLKHQIYNLGVELQAINASKDQLGNELREVTTSKAWKAALMLRSIRVAIMPEGSPQFRLMRFFWRLIF